MTEVRLTVPAALLDHGSDDDIGSEGTLIHRVILGYLRVLDGIIRRQTHHPAACWIEVNRLPVGVGYANEVRRVLEKRHKYVTLILRFFAFGNILNDRNKGPVCSSRRFTLDGESEINPHHRAVLTQVALFAAIDACFARKQTRH